jgi:hypothetical protein
MLKILRKRSIQLKNLSNELLNHSLEIDPRFVRTILEFDGSMTKFVVNMVGGEAKPVVKIIL